MEASAALRKSLEGDTYIRLNDALPDPVKYPELHQRELKAIHEYFRNEEKVAGHSFYGGDLSYSQEPLEPIRNALCSSTNFIPHDAGKESRFYPDLMVSWKTGGKGRHALISLKTREVVFSDEREQMRYNLTEKAHAILKYELEYHRTSRPDALEEADGFLKALKEGAEITINEGFSRSDGPRIEGGESKEDEAKRRGELLIDGFQFMKTGTVVRDTKPLRDLLLKKEAFIVWRGQKACGGFHPDFAIKWKTGERDVSLFICLGCHEVMFANPSANLIYDLPKESYEALKEELEKFRPEPRKAGQ